MLTPSNIYNLFTADIQRKSLERKLQRDSIVYRKIANRSRPHITNGGHTVPVPFSPRDGLLIHHFQTFDDLPTHSSRVITARRPTLTAIHAELPACAPIINPDRTAQTRRRSSVRPEMRALARHKIQIYETPLFKSYETPSEIAFKKLPPILDTPPTSPPTTPKPPDKLMLRRPTVKLCAPLEEADELFKSFAQFLDLKPLKFENIRDNVKFYSKHYPLLLVKLLEGVEEQANIIRTRKAILDISSISRKKRALYLSRKLLQLDSYVDELEEESEIDGCEFITELRDNVFYPPKWFFNRHDLIHDMA
jgi:hypothetical protein